MSPSGAFAACSWTSSGRLCHFPRRFEKQENGATAAGFHHVQDCMDELSSRLAGETGGIVSDRIIVLDVLLNTSHEPLQEVHS